MTRLLRIGAAVIALHVADDTLLQPQPGTSALDHLPGALVQLGAILAALLVAERGKPGVRAAMMLALGLFGAVASVEAVQQADRVGLHGDELTGLLMIPAALALLGAAAVTLWRSRRLDDGRPWRYGRRLLRTAGALIALQMLAFPIGLGYIATHLARPDVPRDDLGVAHEDVAFTTSDGLRLQGWYVPSRNGAAVIVFPGRKSSQRQARVLARHGYGALVFDRRGEGDSEGDPNMFGWGGHRDVLAAVEFLETRDDVQSGRIGGLGLSVGGELMLQVAAETDALDAVIAEGAGSRSYVEDLHEVEGVDRVLGVPFLAVKTAAVGVFSSSSPPPDLNTLMPTITEPTMLIHSDAPNDVRNHDYFAALRGEKEELYMPEAGHVAGITARPAEYERRMIGFLDRTLRR